MPKPKVTIGICVRNCEFTISEAIESIIAQIYPHEFMEVIFVDDGSQDSTFEIINGYIQKMGMAVKVFHHEWKGLGPSRNVVVNNAEGEYILWVDGDMILPKNHIHKQVEFMDNNSRVGIAKARHGFIRGEKIVASLENLPFIILDLMNESMYSNLPGTGGAIFKVNAIRQVNGFDEKLKGVGEDQDIAYRIKNAGWFIKRSPAFFFERRVQSWKRLWEKYFWYGYGDFFLYLKNRKIFSLFRMVPIAGLIAGASIVYYAYKITKNKAVFFLLPFHFSFKMAAWCVGFTKGKIEFSHSQEKLCDYK